MLATTTAIPRAAHAQGTPLFRQICMVEFPNNADEYEDDTTELKQLVALAFSSGDRTGLYDLIKQLEALNPTERCAASPLLDGYWDTLFASTPASWTNGGPVRHVIESFCSSTNLGPGAPGILAGPRGGKWEDVADGRGAYVQRAKLRFGSRELRATYTWLGGDGWSVQYVSSARLFLGVPVWRRQLAPPLSADLDHAVRPTYVDGDLCILRAPAVVAGDAELRTERVYLLGRRKNRLWQDGTFKGLSDRPVMGFDLDP